MDMRPFTDLDIRILAGVLRKQVQKWDETWGDAKWCREQKVDTNSTFWLEQHNARNRADELADMFREEEKRRQSAD